MAAAGCRRRRRKTGRHFPVVWKKHSGKRSRGLASFERHLFICTNQREPGSARGCCSPDGKGELQKLFKEAIGAAGLKATVRANKSGCLDQCEHGPTVVVYPEAVWYGFVQPEDVAEIVQEHIVNGRWSGSAWRRPASTPRPARISIFPKVCSEARIAYDAFPSGKAPPRGTGKGRATGENAYNPRRL